MAIKTTANKHPIVGFHTTVGGENSGIGEHFQRLYDAGIPIALTSEGDYGICKYDALPRAVDGSIIAWRKKHDKWGKDLDVPHQTSGVYHESVDSFFDRQMSVLPKEWDSRTWLTYFNEVDRNQSEKLAEYAIALGKKFKERGIKSMAFGWSSGDPQKSSWTNPKMAEYLRMCEAEPEWYGISIHEYSNTNDSLLHSVPHGYPHQLGRWRELRTACVELGINFSKLTILIKEFGWRRESAPNHVAAIQQLDEFMKVDKSPNLPRTIWYLGGGEFGNVGKETNQLIKPLTDWILNNRYESDIATMPPVGDKPMHPSEKPDHIGYIDNDFGLYKFIHAVAAEYGGVDRISEEWSEEKQDTTYNYQAAVYEDGTEAIAAIPFKDGKWGSVFWAVDPKA